MKHEYKLYYLASPYSHDNPNMRKERYEAVNDTTIILLNQNVYAFSPITYNHPMERHSLPTNWEFWMPYDIAFLERCDMVIVLTLDGWKESVGVTAEIEKAVSLGIPVIYLNPEEVFKKGYKFSDSKEA